MRFADDLTAPLARLTPADVFTAQDAAAHVLATGASGSGKTSGIAKLLGTSYLAGGMGGLVCCLKPDEADLWVARCATAKRTPSLIRWNGRNHGFNFLAYFLSRYGAAGINSSIECLIALLDMIRLASPAQGRPSEQFWTDSCRQMLRHTLPVLHAATGTVRIDELLRFVRSTPNSPEQMADRVWQRQSYFCQAFATGAERMDDEAGARCVDYWRTDFGGLDSKTRSNILISLTTALGRLSQGLLRDAFCSETTIVPELCFGGAVIVMDMPPATYGEDGLVAQLLFKYCWQQAMLARNALPPEQQRRFVFLFADECQAFTVPADADFLATCRSSRVCVVYLTQSLPTLYSKIGGDNPQHRAQHLISNFGTKVWFANSCTETNRWASDIIGRRVYQRASFSQGEGSSRNFGMGMGEGTNYGTSSSMGGGHSSGPNGGTSNSSWSTGSSSGFSDNWNRNRGSGTNDSTSRGYAESMDYRVEPSEFGSFLKTGGRANGGIVTAIWYQAGRKFEASGSNTFYARFQQ